MVNIIRAAIEGIQEIAALPGKFHRQGGDYFSFVRFQAHWQGSDDKYLMPRQHKPINHCRNCQSCRHSERILHHSTCMSERRAALTFIPQYTAYSVLIWMLLVTTRTEELECCLLFLMMMIRTFLLLVVLDYRELVVLRMCMYLQSTPSERPAPCSCCNQNMRPHR